MFEKLRGTISGVSEGFAQVMEESKKEQALLRKQKEAAKKSKKMSAKERSAAKLRQSPTAKKVVNMAVHASSVGRAGSRAGKKLHQKIKLDDEQSKKKIDFLGFSQPADKDADERLRRIFG